MYIYNVTTNIDERLHEKWLTWMKETHIPAMLATKKFTNAKLCRVLVEEEMGGFTYSTQYTTPSKKILEKYYEEDAPLLTQNALKLFADKMFVFNTELEVISEL